MPAPTPTPTPAPAAAFAFTVGSDWNSGFTADIIAKNITGQALRNWTIEFDLPRTITNIWNAKFISKSGDHYTIANESWNASVATGTTINFGFQASGGDGHVSPANVTLNGIPLTASTGTTLPTLSLGDISVDESNSGLREISIPYSLSATSTDAIAVHAMTMDGTATAGEDYVAKETHLMLPAGSTSGRMSVEIVGDTKVESDETFMIKLMNPDGVSLARETAIVTILNDDAPPADPGTANGSLTIKVVDDWGSGFNASAVLKNTDNTAINGWTLTFEWPYEITQIWNAQLVSKKGNLYTIKNVSWNAKIPARGQIDFGFLGKPGNVSNIPIHPQLNGATITIQ